MVLAPRDTPTRERRSLDGLWRFALDHGGEGRAGRWWDGTPGSEDDTAIDTGDLPGVSMEEDVAESLRVELGDTITWEVSGIEVPSVVASLRRVDWERLETNFFAILEPGVLEDAPQTIVLVARLPEESQRIELQRSLVGAFPNVSVFDFSRVQEAIDTVIADPTATPDADALGAYVRTWGGELALVDVRDPTLDGVHDPGKLAAAYARVMGAT